MPFRFLRNPISAVLGPIRGVVDKITSIRDPLGGAIGTLGRALARLGANVQAAELRSRVEREARLKVQSDVAIGAAKRGMLADADIPEATTKLRRKYSYNVLIESIDPATGQLKQQHITISSDRIRGDEEIFAQATEGFAEGYGIQEAHITRIELTGIKKAGAAGTL